MSTILDHSIITKYFTGLTSVQLGKFEAMGPLYAQCNEKVNLISRKDIQYLYERHVLHSLSISKVINFLPGSRIIDIGTGGGFPGIPLAVLFPQVHFCLTDSIAKKINVVGDVVKALELENVEAVNARAETVDAQFDFAVCRAVTTLKELFRETRGKFLPFSKNSLANGLLCLKGGELNEELRNLNRPTTTFSLSEYFQEEFFVTKKLIHVAS